MMRLFGRTISLFVMRRNRIGINRKFQRNKYKRSTRQKPQRQNESKVTLHAKIKSKLTKGTSEHYIYNGSFHEAIGPGNEFNIKNDLFLIQLGTHLAVLAMAQCFSIMPVNNIKAKSAADLYFSWWSLRTIYSCIFIFLTIVLNIIVTMFAFYDQIEFDKIIPVIFYASSSYCRICFIILAMKWPTLMQQWQKVENHLPPLEPIRERFELAHKTKITAIVVTTLSLVEHLLNIISIVNHRNKCYKNSTTPIEDYFRIEQNQLYYFFEFTPFLAFVVKVLNISSTFLWSYMDLFVMVISLGLSSRFQQINTNLMKHKGQKMPEIYWVQNRVNYRNICRLCDSVDKAIGPITIVSFANNLYFVCVQLLKSLNPMPSIAHAIYFWFSLIFLISRTLAVSLYASAVNDQSKSPIQFIRACPAESWCLEVKRFCDEVTTDVVALSGMKFFYLTRKLILSIAGTIITYELVLIQFHKISEARDNYC